MEKLLAGLKKKVKSLWQNHKLECLVVAGVLALLLQGHC